MPKRFQPEFDIVAVMISIAAGLLLLFFGLSDPELAKMLWVAYAFWGTGFFASLALGLIRHTTAFNFTKMVIGVAITGAIIMVYYGINTVYVNVHGLQLLESSKLLSFAIGVSEELFFGVFILGILINYAGLNRIIAVLASAAIHTGFHTIAWGLEPSLLWVFFTCFTISRAIYVLAFPRVSVILAAHGVWNWLVG